MGGADGGGIEGAALLALHRLHLADHRGDAVPVVGVVAQVGVEVVGAGGGVVGAVVQHQFVYIGADLLDGDAFLDDIRKVSLDGEDASPGPAHREVYLPVLDVQRGLHQNAILLHGGDDDRVHEVDDVVVTAALGRGDAEAPIGSGAGMDYGQAVDVLERVRVVDKGLTHPVADKLLQRPLALGIHVKEDGGVQQLHQGLVGDGLEPLGTVGAVADLGDHPGVLLAAPADADEVLLLHIGQSQHRDGVLVRGKVVLFVGDLVDIGVPDHGEVRPENLYTIRSHTKFSPPPSFSLCSAHRGKRKCGCSHVSNGRTAPW